jgi:hypothetical protein
VEQARICVVPLLFFCYCSLPCTRAAHLVSGHVHEHVAWPSVHTLAAYVTRLARLHNLRLHVARPCDGHAHCSRASATRRSSRRQLQGGSPSHTTRSSSPTCTVPTTSGHPIIRAACQHPCRPSNMCLVRPLTCRTHRQSHWQIEKEDEYAREREDRVAKYIMAPQEGNHAIGVLVAIRRV